MVNLTLTLTLTGVLHTYKKVREGEGAHSIMCTFIFKKGLFLFSLMCVCVGMCTCSVGVCRAHRSPGAGVTADCEPPDVGARASGRTGSALNSRATDVFIL